MRVRLQKQICKRRLCRLRLRRWRYATTVHQYSQKGCIWRVNELGDNFAHCHRYGALVNSLLHATQVLFREFLKAAIMPAIKKGRTLAVNTCAIMADKFFELGVVFANQPAKYLSYQSQLGVRKWPGIFDVMIYFHNLCWVSLSQVTHSFHSQSVFGHSRGLISCSSRWLLLSYHKIPGVRK